jgi:hypothetical protein
VRGGGFRNKKKSTEKSDEKGANMKREEFLRQTLYHPPPSDAARLRQGGSDGRAVYGRERGMRRRRGLRDRGLGLAETSGMDLDELRRRWNHTQDLIRRLEAERAESIRRGEPIPRRVEGDLAEARISAEELRMWGNRELTRQIRERF